MEIAYKFVSHEIKSLDTLKDSFAYRMKEKLIKGKQLTRKEKDDLYSALQSGAYSKTGIALMGYMFSFSPWLNKYFIEWPYGGVSVVFAPDVTSIRNHEIAGRKIAITQAVK